MTSINLSSNGLCGITKGFLGPKGTYDATGIQAIANALRVSSSLTLLNIAGNYIGKEGKLALGNAVHESTGCSLGYLTCDEWSVHPETRALDISGKGIDQGDLVLLTGILKFNTSLNYLK